MASKDDPDADFDKLYAIPIYEDKDEDRSFDMSTFSGDTRRHETESYERNDRIDRNQSRGTRGQWRQGQKKSRNFEQNRVDSKSQTRADKRELNCKEGKAYVSTRRSGANKNRSGWRARSSNKEDGSMVVREAQREDNSRCDKDQVKTIKPLSFSKLVYLSKQLSEPDQVVLELSNSRSGFEEFLQNHIEGRCYILLLKILSTVVKTQQLQGLRQILQLVEQYLLAKLAEMLNDMCINKLETRYIWNNKPELERFLSMIAAVLKKSMTTMPSTLSKCSSVIMSMQEVKRRFFSDGEARNLDEEMEETNLVKESIIEEMQKNQKDRLKVKVKPKRRGDFDENRLPPEDFRTLSILPSLVDLQMDEKPFLRANKTKGTYDSLETYLDIQYRLLREDFMAPLRQGITQYRENIRQKSKLTRFKDIRVYDNVQILRPVCSPSGINYILQFDVSKFARINWDASKRLLHGSLLCLSDDSFETAFYAIVSGRKREELKEGMLQVHFENFPEWIQPSNRFVMAETTAYFEAYRHILQGLQETQSMPLQRYIINCETTVKPPEYLLHIGGPKYNFSCLFESGSELSEFPVLNTCLWPNDASLGLDSSQSEALKVAITKELAIIQGPPGTGKTYVGLKIARLLKENKTVWQKSKDSHAILVVCYTNHALDQFLEGVLGFADEGVVRIGGRCNSDLLEKYTLTYLKKKRREERSQTWSIFQNTKDCERLLRQSEQFITGISSRLSNTSTDLVSFELLSEFMNQEQFESFNSHCKSTDKRSNVFYEWLGLKVSNDEEILTEEESRLRFQWETYVVQRAERLPDSHQSTASSVWEKSLLERARIYKTWLSDYISTVELKLKELDSRNGDKTTSATKQFLEGLILAAETQIVDARTLMKYISSLESKIQMQQLMDESHNIFSTEKVIQAWLCLDGGIQSDENINEALDEIQRQVDITTDLEEERELRDEDVFFTFDDEDDETKRGRKQEKLHEEWAVLLKKKKIKQAVGALLRNSKEISNETVASIGDVWEISMSLRRDVYRYWLEMYRNKLREQVKDYEKQFNDAVMRLEEVRNQETIEILKSANFIGMTTTGAAKYRQILQNVGPRIVIVEEAAEVLESHVVTTLNDKCKHLILIGDHKQLRPSTTVYELAKKYNLDISLFERLVNNGILCVTLSEQHRMRPAISIFMRHKNLYPNLKDHPVVHTYDVVKGLDVNVQFITHEEVEGSNSESSSYYNIYEAKFLSRFCTHLLKQGYRPDQISVLTPYMGQVITLRKEMPRPEFEGVRITAVDNFQGEENDIILLSLVRSSKQSYTDHRNPIGFLGVENRVCVALSRAKKGLFVIGNFSLLREKSAIWDYMVRNVEKIDKSIKLICQNHPLNVLHVANPDDFNKTPDGGCQESCGFLLKCGHICERFCHIIDKEHNHVKCFKACPKKCEFGHRCKKKCYEDCKKCETLVQKKVPMCNHIVSMPCHKDPYTWICKTDCTFKLSCGHICNQSCSQCTTSGHRIECKVKCERKLDCGHMKTVACYLGTNVECDALCDSVLDCGHKCSGRCNACLGGKIHHGCQGSCRKLLPCGHRCSFPCSEVCPPCTRKCEYVCPHNIRCRKKCSEPCDECMEDCKFSCKHKACSNLCSEPCSDTKCNEPCILGVRSENRSHECRHKCSGLCGEVCPEMCAVCNKDAVTDSDYIFSENDRFIQLPDCKHIIEVKTMDAIMSQPFEFSYEKVKRCPKCKKVIRQSIKRYANILKDARQAVVKAFQATSGSGKDRQKETNSLAGEIDTLKHIGIGLNDEEVNVLHQQVNPSRFETLLVSKRKIMYLKDLLRTRTNLGMFVRYLNNEESLQYCTDEIENAKKVQSILLKEKHFVSQQHWYEVGMEIKRIDCVLSFLRLLEEKFSDGFEDRVLQSCFERSLKLLTDHCRFDKSRADVIEKVKHRLVNAGTELRESERTMPASHSYGVDGEPGHEKSERSIQADLETLPENLSSLFVGLKVKETI